MDGLVFGGNNNERNLARNPEVHARCAYVRMPTLVLRNVRAAKVEDAASERAARAERRRRQRELEAGDGHGEDSATATDVDDIEDESKEATGAPCNKDADAPPELADAGTHAKVACSSQAHHVDSDDRWSRRKASASKIAKRTAAKPVGQSTMATMWRQPRHRHSSLRSAATTMRSDAIASKQGRSKLRAAVTTCATCDLQMSRATALDESRTSPRHQVPCGDATLRDGRCDSC